jgi:WD40 repeat protein
MMYRSRMAIVPVMVLLAATSFGQDFAREFVSKLACGNEGAVIVGDNWGGVAIWMARPEASQVSSVDLVAEFKPKEKRAAVVAATCSGSVGVSATMDGLVSLWNLKTATRLRSIPVSRSGVCAIALSHDNAMIAVGEFPWFRSTEASVSSECRVYFCPTTGEPSLDKRISGSRHGIVGLAFHPDGSKLAVASSDGEVALWSVSEGYRLWHRRCHDRLGELAVSPDGRFILTKGFDPAIVLSDAISGAQIWTMNSADPNKIGAFFLQDGDLLIWDGNSDTATTLRPPGMDEIRKKTLDDVGKAIRRRNPSWRSCMFPDGRLIETTVDGEVRCIDLRSTR